MNNTLASKEKVTDAIGKPVADLLLAMKERGGEKNANRAVLGLIAINYITRVMRLVANGFVH